LSAPNRKCLVTIQSLNETQMINLYLNERRAEDVTILDLKGRERMRGATIALHESIRCLAREGKTQVLLDLARVKHIDSGALGELVSSHATLEEKGGALKLMHMTESVRELMTVTKLLTVFDVYDDEPEALASFVGETLRIVEHKTRPRASLVDAVVLTRSGN
jgi:anti-sigma B factor antagonist